MRHRHLNHQRLTLAAIGDVITRGRGRYWAEPRQASVADHALFDKIEHVCRPYVSDPYAQCHHFWATMLKSTAPLPDLELVLSFAARLQSILPDAVLAGGTASAIHAGHPFSRDARHVSRDRHQLLEV
ncbi:MAG: hypothetical protein ACP5QR_17340 [Rhizomicrobium sp.]